MSTMSTILVLSTALFVLSNGALSADEEAQLLELHNDARSDTAQGNMVCNYGSGKCPRGTITRMKWSSSLASDAQSYAETLASTCSLDHASGISDGENLAWSFCSSTSCLRTVLATCEPWITDESPDYQYGYAYTGANFGGIGHFTQIINSDTLYVGCGCADSTSKCTYDFGTYYSRNCVCRYSPAGNMLGSGTSNTIAYPYTTSSGCVNSNCPSGYNCDSDSLCDDGGANGLSGDATGVEEPTTTTTSAPDTTESGSGSGGSGSDTSNPSSVVITGFDNFSYLNGMIFNSAAGVDGTRTSSNYVSYGPTQLWSYTFYIYYDTRYGYWVLTYSGLGSGSRTAYCNDAGQTIITSCTSWNDWAGASNFMVVSTAQAYSSSSSSNSSEKDRLIEGLLIGLGIAIGVFAISLLIYWCVKRRNTQKTQYNVVEMNNEISNHEYVNMDN